MAAGILCDRYNERMGTDIMNDHSRNMPGLVGYFAILVVFAIVIGPALA